MKRFTLILALALMVAMPSFAERVNSETAQKVATTFLNNNGAKSAQLTDLSKEAGFPNLYIFNAEPGFVVMSADDCIQPILGYSLTGKFVAENMPTNISGWLHGYNDEIQYAIENQMKASTETAKLWKDLIDGDAKAAKATVVVDALIQTTWDQDPGYNDLCPYDNNAGELTVTGCVATAMAQIMRYWEYPSHGLSSHSYTPSTHPEYGTQYVNFAAATYNWIDMPLYSSSDEIAKLMYHCGVSVDMDYDIANNGGSGASSSIIPNALTTYFNYKSGIVFKYKSSYSSDNWLSLIKTELNAGRPVEYNGSGSGGHAFVCDGYDNANYFHFNWGWSGRNNGFFSLSNLNPGSGGSGGGNYNFTNNQSAVIGIQPKDCTVSTPTNFNVTAQSRDAILTWNETNNAAAYSIYRNGSLIANTTSTTYTDSNLAYGSYAYYVKSRDANGAASSPTATVTAAIQPIPSNLTITKNGNSAILNWTEPEWSVPQTDDEVLTYGDGSYATNFGVSNVTNMYWGHRYPTSAYSNKVLYKVSFYTNNLGSFKVFIYKGSSATSARPSTKLKEQTITVSATGWIDIELDSPIQIDNTKDLWVFMYDPEGRDYPAVACSYSGNDGNYFAGNPTNNVNTWSGYAFNIRTYIADGAFTYNLYDNSTNIASNLSGTSYNIASIANNTAHQYTLKTNFNDGLTNASNMAGLTIGTATLSSLSLGANDKMTVTEGSRLTVSGTLNNENADNLILENGAQLVSSSTGVQATMKKNITAYSGDGGWYILASPFAESINPSADNGFLTNRFDLYTFNQSEAEEWRNYEAQSFTIENKTGYLYANSGNPTLTFAGTLVANTTATALTYDSNAKCKGLNLIGNPYPCNTNVDRSFYVLNDDGSEFTLGSNPVPPCAAILVQAQGAGESVTFSKTTVRDDTFINLSVSKADAKDNTIVDQARISFNPSDRLMKYNLKENSSRLYIPQNGQDLAVAYANGENEMPLNFMTTQNGTYTLNIKAENLELSYLHLIDNLTGNDIDLLSTPSYTFEAKTTDYASRFKLIFAPNEVDAACQSIIFYANGHLQVFNENEAQLQIVDVMGRVLSTETIQGNHKKALNLNEGIYVVRLTKGSEVKTQKIVVQ